MSPPDVQGNLERDGLPFCTCNIFLGHLLDLQIMIKYKKDCSISFSTKTKCLMILFCLHHMYPTTYIRSTKRLYSKFQILNMQKHTTRELLLLAQYYVFLM